MVSVLYTRERTAYKDLGADCWDIQKDARKWPGGNSVICHPPCRGWGNFRHKAKTREDEHSLAIHSVIMVRLWGGILEHPSTSKLWDIMNLPKPGKRDIYGGWTLCIDQNWFGHRAIKRTYLYIVGINPNEIPAYPIGILKQTTVENMGRPEREKTPALLANWLSSTAKMCNNQKKLLTYNG